jgi:hypothetical protein
LDTTIATKFRRSCCGKATGNGNSDWQGGAASRLDGSRFVNLCIFGSGGRMGLSLIFYSARDHPRTQPGFKSAPASLRTELSRPFPTTDGGTLRTLAGSRVMAQNRTPSGFGYRCRFIDGGRFAFLPGNPVKGRDSGPSGLPSREELGRRQSCATIPVGIVSMLGNPRGAPEVACSAPLR